MGDVNWALISPLLIMQAILQIIALVSLFKAERIKGSKWLWAAIILLGGVLGPIVYFVIAREEV